MPQNKALLWTQENLAGVSVGFLSANYLSRLRKMLLPVSGPRGSGHTLPDDFYVVAGGKGVKLFLKLLQRRNALFTDWEAQSTSMTVSGSHPLPLALS